MRKVAILGVHPRTADLAPWNDDTWEKWGLGRHHVERPVQRLFEMHVPEHPAFPGVEQLNKATVHIYMQERYQDVSWSIRYPIESVIEETGYDYFSCTVAYIIAFAILSHIDTIGIWGIEGLEREYAKQRENIHFWLGMAIGKGVDIVIPEGCSLLRDPFGVRYGT